MKFIDLINNWHARAGRAQTAHFIAAAKLERLKYWLGIPSITISTIVGSSLFAVLQESTDTTVKLVAAGAVMLSAILASIQTFLGHAERAEKHKEAGARYGRLKRKIERISVFPPTDVVDQEKLTTELEGTFDELSEQCPTIPIRTWEKIRKVFESKHNIYAQQDAPADAKKRRA